MIKLLSALAISFALAIVGHSAFAASVVVTGVIESPASTSVTCTPVSTALTFPAPPNSLVCPIAIFPTGWSGAVTLSDPTHFATGSSGGALYLQTGATSPPAGPFSVTVTTTP
jgi:hypothetical protein